MRKGVELPANTLVVLALAMVVLLALVSFFTGAYNPTRSTTEAQAEFRNECLRYVSAGCCNEGVSCATQLSSLQGKAQDAGISADRAAPVCCSESG